jgi:hypothetical protein
MGAPPAVDTRLVYSLFAPTFLLDMVAPKGDFAGTYCSWTVIAIFFSKADFKLLTD